MVGSSQAAARASEVTASWAVLRSVLLPVVRGSRRASPPAAPAGTSRPAGLPDDGYPFTHAIRMALVFGRIFSPCAHHV